MITFKEDTHQYFLGDTELISVTTLMKKHGLSPNYGNVPTEVLRAKAERGTLIHKEIEDYIKTGELGFTEELINFINARNEQNNEILQSEYLVHNDILAGTADLLLFENDSYIIADIKTTSTVHKEAVSWQLSIYAELLHTMKPNLTVTRGQVYHFDKEGNLNILEIPLKPVEEVRKLIECERQGLIYKQELTTVNNADLTALYEVETLIKNIENQKKEAEARAVELRAAIMAAMEENGVTTFENENIKLTIKQPYERVTLDSTKLKKDMPEVAEKYTKKVMCKASLTITLKEDN